MNTEKHISQDEVMIDLETLSLRSNASILVLAAIKFSRKDPEKNLSDMDIFYAKISKSSCEKIGMHIDNNTLEWWKTQKPEIRNEIFSEPRENIKDVLIRFSEWFKGCEKIWSHGATFDIPILAEAYSLCGLAVPWKFWNARDTRTLFDLTDINIWKIPDKDLHPHHALHDCYRQIKAVKQGFRLLK